MKRIFLSIVLLLFSSIHSAQIEGGANWDLKRWNWFASFDLFLFTAEETTQFDNPLWKGYMLHTTYEDGSGFYVCPMFGQVEEERNTLQSIFIGPKFGINEYKRIGICIKGSTFISKTVPFSLIIDPKYEFDGKGFIWDFKASLGLGAHKPLDRLFGGGKKK